MSQNCKCCPASYGTCDFMPERRGGMQRIKWSEQPCCEAMRRVESVPGDASTLIGWNCPIHGLVLRRGPLASPPEATALELHQTKVRLLSVTQDRDYCARNLDKISRERDDMKATLEYIRDTSQNAKLIAAAVLEKLARKS